MSETAINNPLLAIENLRTSFFTRDGEVQAVRGVSFSVRAGEIVGIVGESGCGKSVTCKSVIQLLGGNGRIVGGQIRFRGDDLAGYSPKALRRLRGNDIAMIFQDSMTALNPVLTIGQQMRDILMRNQQLDKKNRQATGDCHVTTGGYHGCRAAIRSVSPRIQRRHAPAGDDRHCVVLPSGAADC
ncbi:hypothetical protein DZS_20140 [Dickeya ananatis]